MELKDYMEASVCFLSLSREKQQYASGIIKGLAISEQIEKEKKYKEIEEENEAT